MTACIGMRSRDKKVLHPMQALRVAAFCLVLAVAGCASPAGPVEDGNAAAPATRQPAPGLYNETFTVQPHLDVPTVNMPAEPENCVELLITGSHSVTGGNVTLEWDSSGGQELVLRASEFRGPAEEASGLSPLRVTPPVEWAESSTERRVQFAATPPGPAYAASTVMEATLSISLQIEGAWEADGHLEAC